MTPLVIVNAFGIRNVYQALHPANTALGHRNSPVLLVYIVVAVAFFFVFGFGATFSKLAHNRGKLYIIILSLIRRAADDKRSTGFVNQNVINFVDYCVI